MNRRGSDAQGFAAPILSIRDGSLDQVLSSLGRLRIPTRYEVRQGRREIPYALSHSHRRNSPSLYLFPRLHHARVPDDVYLHNVRQELGRSIQEHPYPPSMGRRLCSPSSFSRRPQTRHLDWYVSLSLLHHLPHSSTLQGTSTSYFPILQAIKKDYSVRPTSNEIPKYSAADNLARIPLR